MTVSLGTCCAKLDKSKQSHVTGNSDILIPPHLPCHRKYLTLSCLPTFQDEHERQLAEERQRAAATQEEAAGQLETLQKRLRETAAELASRTAEVGVLRVKHQDLLAKSAKLEVRQRACTPFKQSINQSLYIIEVVYYKGHYLL